MKLYSNFKYQYKITTSYIKRKQGMNKTLTTFKVQQTQIIIFLELHW